MNKLVLQILVLFTAVSFTLPATLQAQFRDKQVDEYDYTGNIVQEDRYKPGNWADMLNMKMAHSYSMTFSSVGGEYHNLNMYTNTMFFDFTEKLDGRLDLSVAHSPFGNSPLMSNNQQGGLGSEIYIRNAELKYQFNENTSIHVSYRQNPYYRGGFGRYGGFGDPWRDVWMTPWP